MTTPSDDFDDLDSALESLLDAGESLPPKLERTLVAWEGGQVADALLDIVRDEELAGIGGRGDGWAPVHAVRILSQRGDIDVVAPLARRLRTTDPGDALHDAIVQSMGRFGPSAAEPVLDVFDESLQDGEIEALLSLIDAAYETGAVTERLNRAMITYARYEPDFVRLLLETYDDVPAVLAGMEELAENIADEAPADRPDDDTIRELCDVIEALGGSFPDALDPVAQRTSRTGSTAATPPKDANPGGIAGRDEPYVDDSPDIGRNEPCPCGSGRKYKKCCMRS